MQFPAGLFACELPVDRDAVAVDAALPSMNFAAKSVQVTDSALFQTLAAEPCSRRFRPGLANCRAWADREAVPQQAIHRQPERLSCAECTPHSISPRITLFPATASSRGSGEG